MEIADNCLKLICDYKWESGVAVIDDFLNTGYDYK